MRQEDVWGSLDERWKGREPAAVWRRFRKPLLRVGAVLLLLLLLGAGYVETGFALRTSTLIDEAVKECRDRGNALSEQNCAPAIWKVCHLEYANSVSGSVGNETVSGAVDRLCRIALFSEVAELAFVLALKYGDRYFLEERSEIYYPPKSPPQEFYCFHSIIYKREFWFRPSGIGENADTYLVPPEVDSCRGPSISTGAVAVDNSLFSGSAKRTLKRLSGVVFSQLLDYSSARPAPGRMTDENLVLPEMQIAEGAAKEPIPDWGSEEMERACYAARNALREKLPEAQMAADRCLMAAEQMCKGTAASTEEHCSAAYQVQIERLWQQLPSVCAQAIDISKEQPNDSCREAALRICQSPNITSDPLEYNALAIILDITCQITRPVGYSHIDEPTIYVPEMKNGNSISSDAGQSSENDSVTRSFFAASDAPIISIERPFPNMVFAESQGFLLDASGYDRKDGGLPSEAFTWFSSIDGNLGTGAFLVLSASDLTPGTHTITLIATDSDNITSTANVNITITTRNALPVANDDAIFAELEATIRIDVLANDIDIEGDFDSSSLEIERPPQFGAAKVSTTRTGKPMIDYSPITGGEDTFTYSICDGLYRCDSAEVTVVFHD